jgi:putative transposase
VKANQAKYPVATMCRVLEASTSSYYACRVRPRSKRAQGHELITERIIAMWNVSRQSYGAPRIHHDFKEAGERIGKKRIARLMKHAEIEGVTRRKGIFTTRRDKDARPAPDLVERNFSASAPNELWVADITYVPTWAGFLYLAVVMDAWSRRIVGWSMATHLRTQLALDALNMAVWQRQPSAVIHHSDQGCQYTSIDFGRCKHANVRPSMGSVADCYDNAMCESFFATLECERLDRTRFKSQAEAKLAVFDFIEGWYNPHRRHSALGYESPAKFEAAQMTVA